MKNMLIMDGGFMVALAKMSSPSIDLKKLRMMLEARFGKIDRSHWFTCHNDLSQRSFHTWLTAELRAQVMVYGTKIKTCGHCGGDITVEKGIDVGITTDAIKFAHRDSYDRLILANGDGDIVDAIKYIRDDLGKQVVLVGTSSCTSNELLVHCDEFIDVFDERNIKKLLREYAGQDLRAA